MSRARLPLVAKISISLPRDLLRFARMAVRSGQFATVSDVMRTALRDLRELHPAVAAASLDGAHPLLPPRVDRRRRRDRKGDLTQIELAHAGFAAEGQAIQRVLMASRVLLATEGVSAEGRARFAQVISILWHRQVKVIDASDIDDPTAWIPIYVAALAFSGSETDSSSTS
jgi:hypothetical protein